MKVETLPLLLPILYPVCLTYQRPILRMMKYHEEHHQIATRSSFFFLKNKLQVALEFATLANTKTVCPVQSPE